MDRLISISFAYKNKIPTAFSIQSSIPITSYRLNIHRRKWVARWSSCLLRRCWRWLPFGPTKVHWPKRNKKNVASMDMAMDTAAVHTIHLDWATTVDTIEMVSYIKKNKRKSLIWNIQTRTGLSGGYNDYTTGGYYGGYNSGYNGGYNSGIIGRPAIGYSSGGYNSNGLGYSGLNSGYSGLGTSSYYSNPSVYSGLQAGGYRSGFGHDYSSIGSVGYSGYPYTRGGYSSSAYTSPYVGGTVYNQNGGYYY